MESLNAVMQKIMHKLRRPEQFRHVPWTELFTYTLRQGLGLVNSTAARCLAGYRVVDDRDAALPTPYGTVYVPRALDRTALRYLLRETFDPGHWHHFDSKETPVAEGDCVVDCGASEGLWSLTIAARVKKLYLIEPQEAFIRVLRRTFAAFIEKGTVEILPCAVGNCDGRCTLVGAGEADVMGTVTEDANGSVPLFRLDTLLSGQRVDFIKADVEGAEMDVLEGAEEAIRRWQPNMAVAVYHEANDWQALCDYVCGRAPGYRWKLTGMTAWGKPLMLHLWMPQRRIG